MNHDESPLPPSTSLDPQSSPSPQPVPQAEKQSVVWVFMGENGLRAGWKFVLFILVLQALIFATRPIRHHLPRPDPMAMKAMPVAVQDTGMFVVVVLTTLILIRLVDKRPWSEYGLPLRQAFRSRFWIGAVLGFGALAVQLAIMRAGGWFYFGSLQLRGSTALKQAALWGLAFIAVGLFEEFLLRGYILRALTGGVGFWPAALGTSLLFAAAHLANKGENPFGIAMVFMDGVLMCFLIWKTGDLWMAVGQHFAWDWAETFFFGVPNSGTVAVGALRSPVFHGPVLLSGGTAGPEGSVVVVIPLILTALVVAALYRKPRTDTARSLASAA